MHDPEPDALDLDACHPREAVPQRAVIVVAPHADEPSGPAQALVQKAFIDQSPAWMTTSASSIALPIWSGRFRARLGTCVSTTKTCASSSVQ
jgi:hypothetical protein